MEEIAVPPYFICPISLEIMRDPVIVPTGITYDRESIEKWLFSGKNITCPVTRQVISDCDLTPNHTLRRLIQSWCTLNASHGIERIPTPKPPISKTQVLKLLRDSKSPQQQAKCLRELRSMASDNETNKRCMEAAGVVQFLATIVSNFNSPSHAEESLLRDDICDSSAELTRSPSEEALSILYTLQVSEPTLRNLACGQSGEFIESLIKIMRSGSYESRAYAVLMLKSVLEAADPLMIISLRPQLFIETVSLLRDQISQQASKTALQLLINLCPWGRNRVKTVEANAVSVLIDLLMDSSEKRVSEMGLTLLDLLCQCAEGRAEFLGHAAGLAVVSKKILRVSQVGSERGVRILLSVSKFSATSSVLQEMLQVGVVAKLCLVVQVDCGTKTKEKAREVLKLHAKAWKDSPCVPASILTSCPA